MELQFSILFYRTFQDYLNDEPIDDDSLPQWADSRQLAIIMAMDAKPMRWIVVDHGRDVDHVTARSRYIKARY